MPALNELVNDDEAIQAVVCHFNDQSQLTGKRTKRRIALCCPVLANVKRIQQRRTDVRDAS